MGQWTIDERGQDGRRANDRIVDSSFFRAGVVSETLILAAAQNHSASPGKQLEYANGYAHVIECVIKGGSTNPDAGTLVLGAHFDFRRASFFSSWAHVKHTTRCTAQFYVYPTAPGTDAEDDGSGTALLLLSIARYLPPHM